MAASSGDKTMQILADAAKSEDAAIAVLTNLVKDRWARKNIFKKVISMVRKQKIPTELISPSTPNVKRARPLRVTATPAKN